MKKSDLMLLIPYLLTLAFFVAWMFCMERAEQNLRQEAEALIERFHNSEIHVVNVQNMSQPVTVRAREIKRLHVEGMVKSFDVLSDSSGNDDRESRLNVEGGINSWESSKTGDIEYVEGGGFTYKDYKERRRLDFKEGIRISNDTLYLDGVKYSTYGSILIEHPDVRDVVSRNNSVEVTFERAEVSEDAEHRPVMDESLPEFQMMED